MSARPALEEAPTQAAVEVEHLSKCFTGRHGGSDVIAIDDVSLRIEAGATLGIVGESGSGKSTLARCLLGLVTADAGHATILGIDTVNLSARDLRLLRRRAQIVFQEPYEALDPRQRVGAAIAEPLKLHQRLRGQQLAKRVDELMRLVVLDPTLRARFPHQLSGGQQQRVNIARALANDPDLLVLDEPTSSLDVSVRSEILGLLVTLQQRLGMTYVLVSHDIATIRAMCTHVAVMYLGRIVEHGEAQHVLAAPSHPYTRYLLGSVLSLVPDERTEIDALPAANVADNQPGRRGCCFATRCPIRVEECSTVTPALVERGSETRVACHLAGDER